MEKIVEVPTYIEKVVEKVIEIPKIVEVERLVEKVIKVPEIQVVDQHKVAVNEIVKEVDRVVEKVAAPASQCQPDGCPPSPICFCPSGKLHDAVFFVGAGVAAHREPDGGQAA